MKTLQEFVALAGSRAQAAVSIGVAETTLWRWIEGKSKPRGLALRRLMDLGIQFQRAAGRSEIVRVVQVRPAAEAFEKNNEEMLLGMLAMSPSERVADVDAMRIRLWGLRRGGRRPPRMERTVRVVERPDGAA